MITQEALNILLLNAKRKIPSQGPLEYFVHHNPLEHYKNIGFADAAKKAAHEFGCQAFMPELFYQSAYRERKIGKSILLKSIEAFKRENKISLSANLIFELLIEPIAFSENAEMLHFVEQTQAKHYFEKRRFHDHLIKENLSIDPDFYTHPTLYKFFSSYYDYGTAYWNIENVEQGLWACYCQLYQSSYFFNNSFYKNLSKIIKEFRLTPPHQFIAHVLDEMQYQEEEIIEDYFLYLLAKHKGWAGFVKALDAHPSWKKGLPLNCNYAELMSVILTTEYALFLTYNSQLIDTIKIEKQPIHQKCFLQKYHVFLSKHPELSEDFYLALPYLSDQTRQEILHEAYEETFYEQLLVAYAQAEPSSRTSNIECQVICCIDDREESFRRYIELNASYETFGTAGHFALNLRFKKNGDKYFRDLCPVVVEPEYEATEQAGQSKFFNKYFRYIIGEVKWVLSSCHKTLIGGLFQPFLNGIPTIIPTALATWSPQFYLSLKNRLKKCLNLKNHPTEIIYDINELNPKGISFEKQLAVANNFLNIVGLTHDFAEHIFILGHGSSSLNNPLEAAYDCGACGGGRGLPNARILASILNKTLVRKKLKEEYALCIPRETLFIAGYHNTCSDEVLFYDIAQHTPSLNTCITHIREAAKFNSKERSRRFTIIPKGKSKEFYHKKMQSRASDLRQPRPEYGHATNAVCIIGDRNKTKSIYLDRRAFLVSYRWQDDEHATILDTLTKTAVPVCTGINLEYYFSYIDNEFYGCGTKLPHNISGLIGLINGYMSDLQLGLAWQMVEIHQPIRLFLIIESPLKTIETLLAKKQSEFSTLVKNNWIKLAVSCPHTQQLWLYREGEFTAFHTQKSSPRYFATDEMIYSTEDDLTFGHIVL